MTTVIFLLMVFIFSLWYIKNPDAYLKRKYKDGEVPERAVKTARIMGILLAILTAVLCIVLTLNLGGKA